MQDNHIMKHDTIYVLYLTAICLVLSVMGAGMAFHG